MPLLTQGDRKYYSITLIGDVTEWEALRVRANIADCPRAYGAAIYNRGAEQQYRRRAAQYFEIPSPFPRFRNPWWGRKLLDPLRSGGMR
jgi:hypothetical protein